MNLPPRQQSIIEEVRERGYLSIEEMAQMFAVTPQTIRRDINQLAEQGLLRRYHGGAAYDSSIENTAYTMRADQMRDEKQRIAEAVASLVPDNASLFINIGMVAGGTVRSDGGIVGQAAVDFIQQFRVDFALVGISGIDEDGSLLDFDYQEVRVSQAIIDNARQVFLAADSSKFGRNAVVRLGPISLVNRVISDSPPPAAIARLMAQHKVHLDLV